jgi:hypothetical protein
MHDFVPAPVISYWRAAPVFHLLGVCALLLPLMGGACGELDADAAPPPSAPLAAASDTGRGRHAPDRAPQSGCAFEGKRYAVGDTFHDALRCNGCACSTDGVVCTERFCDPAEACSLGDARFASGTSVVCSDGCNRCQCADGWTSTLALCGPLPKVAKCDDAPQGVVRSEVLYREGDALALELGTGGCQGDTPPIKLCWDGAIAESAPVQMRLRAVPTSITSCSGWVTQQKVFDLSPLREAFTTAYPGQAGQVRVLLDGQAIDYRF